MADQPIVSKNNSSILVQPTERMLYGDTDSILRTTRCAFPSGNTVIHLSLPQYTPASSTIVCLVGI